MLNFFRRNSAQSTTQVLPETVEEEDLPDGVPPVGKVCVTIASQFGSGGSEVGRIVARDGGLLYLNHEIITEVARRAGMKPEQAAIRDERTLGMAQHVLEALHSNRG